MNCRRVEKLIPLYVEGDLKPDLTSSIASHLDWCGRCNWLSDEYKESQSWLRSSEPPAFDTAALNGLKVGIVKCIEEAGARRSLLAYLVQQWSRRQVFALSAAMLIIFGVVVFYIYQTRMMVVPAVVQTAEQAPDKESPQSLEPQQADDTGMATGAGSSSRHHHKRQANIKARAGTPRNLEQSSEPLLVPQVSELKEPETVSVEPNGAPRGSGNDLPEMLRIEIQTSDPNIRIIWFAPKEVGSSLTTQ